MTGVSIEHLVWGGGATLPTEYISTSIRGYSGCHYPGNFITSNAYSLYPQLYIGSNRLYLYHGSYNGKYGIFYFVQGSSRYDHSYLSVSIDSYTDYNLSYEVIFLCKGRAITISEIINNPDVMQYFEVMPTSWLHSFLSYHGAKMHYDLCFVAQSDIEEFLNTYWKYEGGN